MYPTRILCFGDSNTWGRSGVSTERYPEDVRWTGLLQQRLGPGSVVIEEGLRSRTTDLHDDDPQFPYRNGAEYLRPCLESHNPLDIIILWLGTNDLKAKFDRRAEDVATALGKMVETIHTTAHTRDKHSPQVILVSPPLVREEVLKPGSQFNGAGAKSRELSAHIKLLAEKYNCTFIDLAVHVQAGRSDGVHLEPEMHPVVADLIHQEVRRLLN